MENLSASLEDYLELICNLLETSDSLKAVEIARRLNVSRSAVSEALLKLAEKNLINYEGHKGITITSEGLTKAKNVILKHNIITEFFHNTLGLEKKTAEENACRIEHVISDDVFEKLKDFQTYCNQNEDFISKFQKGN